MRPHKSIKVLQSIQILRAVAAILVVLFHAQIAAREWAAARAVALPSLDSFGAFQSFGGIGVDLFFVISGFIMASVTWNSFGSFKAIEPFIIKRFVRIAPIYWFYTICFVILSVLLKDFSTGREIGPKKVILSLFFLPTLDADGTKSHILAVAWTLVYEIFFYICVCIAIPFSRKYFLPIITFIFLMVVLVLPRLVGLLLNRDFPFMKNSGLLLEFLYGILICILLKKEMRMGKLVPAFILLVGIILMAVWIIHPFPYERAFAWGLPCAFIVFGSVFLESQKSVPPFLAQLVPLGNASYSLYLVHMIIFNLLILLLRHLSAPLSADRVMLLLTFASILCSMVLFKLVEKKLTYFASARLKQ